MSEVVQTLDDDEPCPRTFLANVIAQRCFTEVSDVLSGATEEELQTRDDHGRTLLFDAAGRPMDVLGTPVALCQLLVDTYKFDVSAVNTKRQTPVFEAVINGNANVCSYLISRRADPDHMDGFMTTCLSYACNFNKVEVVKVLLQNKANHAAEDSVQQPALFYAASKSVDCAAELLRAKAHVDAANHRGQTPLFFASHSGNLEMVELLLASGADACLLDQRNRPAAYCALEQSRVEVAMRLLREYKSLWRAGNGSVYRHAAEIDQPLIYIARERGFPEILDILQNAHIKNAAVLPRRPQKTTSVSTAPTKIPFIPKDGKEVAPMSAAAEQSSWTAPAAHGSTNGSGRTPPAAHSESRRSRTPPAAPSGSRRSKTPSPRSNRSGKPPPAAHNAGSRRSRTPPPRSSRSRTTPPAAPSDDQEGKVAFTAVVRNFTRCTVPVAMSEHLPAPGETATIVGAEKRFGIKISSRMSGARAYKFFSMGWKEFCEECELGIGDHVVMEQHGRNSWRVTIARLKCMICNRSDDESQILLCDRKCCDNGCHLHCVSPPLEKAPEGNWYCPKCQETPPRVHARKSDSQPLRDSQTTRTSRRQMNPVVTSAARRIETRASVRAKASQAGKKASPEKPRGRDRIPRKSVKQASSSSSDAKESSSSSSNGATSSSGSDSSASSEAHLCTEWR